MARKELDEWLFISSAELQRLGDELSTHGPKIARGPGWAPRVDVLETATKILLTVELAGMHIEGMGIFYNSSRHSLTMKGCREQEALLNGERAVHHQLEIEYGEFMREVRLPVGPIVPEQVRATYKNGFLTILIPKATPDEAVFVTRSITIRKK